MTDALGHERDAASGDGDVAPPVAERSVGEHIFIWIAWALAAAFWGGSITIFMGILRDVALPAPAPGAAAVGGAGWALIVLAGLGIIALAVATGYWRDMNRGAVRAAAGDMH